MIEFKLKGAEVLEWERATFLLLERFCDLRRDNVDAAVALRREIDKLGLGDHQIWTDADRATVDKLLKTEGY